MYNTNQKLFNSRKKWMTERLFSKYIDFFNFQAKLYRVFLISDILSKNKFRVKNFYDVKHDYYTLCCTVYIQYVHAGLCLKPKIWNKKMKKNWVWSQVYCGHYV